MSEIKIVLVDDNPLIREGIKILLYNSTDITICGEANNGSELLKIIDYSTPDIILMDVKMPGTNGIDLTRKIRVAFPDIKVIMLTSYYSRKSIKQAFRAGASGFLTKKTSTHELSNAIHSVMNGNTYVSEILENEYL